MKKIFTKLIGATLGLAMAIGVGVGVTANNRKAAELNADDGLTATYTVASKTSVTPSGTRPNGSAATYSQTYSTQSQATSGNSFTLTLTGYDGCTITGLSLSMKSNSKGGAGYMSFVTGSTTMASIGTSSNGVAFNNNAWYGSYSTSPVTVTPAWSNNGTVANNGTIVLTIGATANSLYFYSATITYSSAGEAPTVTNVAKKTAPTYTSYYAGESFDPSGLVVTVTYSDASTLDVAYDNNKNDFSWEPTTITAAGDVEIQYLTYSTMKVSQAVSLVTPLSVSEAMEAIDGAQDKQVPNAYVSGIISQVDEYHTSYHSITYWISSDGTTTNQLEVYSGKDFGGANFSSINDLSVGDQVVVRGLLKKYNDVYEFASNNRLVSRIAAPRVYSIDLTPSSFTLEPGDSDNFTNLFTEIVINQNDVSTKTVNDIEWSSDDDDIVLVAGDEYLVTGSHRESTTIKASIDGVVYGTATVSIFDPNVYIMDYDTSIWTLVDDPSTLVAGDKVILTGIKGDNVYAAGTYGVTAGSGNNIQSESHTLVAFDNKVKDVNDTMIYTLEAGTKDDSLAFKDSSGKYLYAACGTSTNNYMRVQNSIDDNASFILNQDGTVVGQGTGSRMYMRYNNDNTSNLFSCYSSTSTVGSLVTFYKYGGGQKGEVDLPSLVTIASANEDENGTFINLGFELSTDDWNDIDSVLGIAGYGIMLIRETTLDTAGFDTIEEAYYSDSASQPNLKDLTKASTTAPQDGSIIARINITKDSNRSVIFRAAAYVISENGTYCFINEVTGSLVDLLS